MQRILFLFCLLSIIRSALLAQTIQPLSDNMDVQSNTQLKILGGVYNIQDQGNDGLIRIQNVHHVLVDGDSVFVDGLTYTGCLIRIENSDSVIIRNFPLAMHFFYAVRVINSTNVRIENNNFSLNKSDSAGWINIWAGPNAALGGGILLEDSRNIGIHYNLLKEQNDGIAAYACKHLEINGNDLSWNTAFGIRLYFSDSSSVHHNLARHIRKPNTNPAGCAGLLMIGSRENGVFYNDFSQSENGIYQDQYQYSGIASNSVIAYNECSGALHTALTSLYSGGNELRANVCSYSLRGMVLDYSFNTVIDSNIIMENHHSGISIDRGFQNRIRNNFLSANPIGIDLHEDPPVPGYNAQHSRSTMIYRNAFTVNHVALQASDSDSLLVLENGFEKNYTGIVLDGSSTGDTLSLNLFDRSLEYEIRNVAAEDIYAGNNTFYFNDTTLITSKILDKQDDTAYGQVFWNPFIGLHNPVFEGMCPVDLTEPDAEWQVYSEPCNWMGNPIPLTLYWDTLDVVAGDASLHLSTGTGWFVNAVYRPAGETISDWNLIGCSYLYFQLKSFNTNLGGFQNFRVKIGNSRGGYFLYAAPGILLNQSIGTWQQVVIPLAGNGTWVREQQGIVDWNSIHYVEVGVDTYGAGFELWMDEMVFILGAEITENIHQMNPVRVAPNPARDEFWIHFPDVPESDYQVELVNLEGKRISVWNLSGGNISEHMKISGIPPSVYMWRILSGNAVQTGKLVIIP